MHPSSNGPHSRWLFRLDSQKHEQGFTGKIITHSDYGFDKLICKVRFCGQHGLLILPGNVFFPCCFQKRENGYRTWYCRCIRDWYHTAYQLSAQYLHSVT